MPSEDTPVRKLGSIEAANFWERQGSVDVTSSFRIKDSALRSTYTTFVPPYQKQQGPWEPLTTYTFPERSFSLPPRGPVTPFRPICVNSSTDINIKVLQKEMRALEEERGRMNKQHSNALKIIKGMGEYMANQ